MEDFAGDVRLSEAQLAQELRAFLGLCEETVNCVKVGLDFARQVNVGCAVGLEWNDMRIVLETNERHAKKVGAGGVAPPEAFLVEQESVELDHPGSALGGEEIGVEIIGQVFRFDLVNVHDLAQEMKKA